MDLITIGLPIYNVQDFIESAIISLKNQSYENWFCIIVDDSSTDKSVQIVKSMTKFDDRFSVILDSENKGLSFRLNQISAMCQTKYLARMDADDIMHPDRLVKQLQYLSDHPNIDVVGSDAYTIDTTDVVCGYKKAPSDFDILNAIQGALFIHPSIMGRAEWFKNNPYDLDANRSEDYELWLRTAGISRFENIEEPLMFYREVGLRHAAKYSATSDGIVGTLERYLESAPLELAGTIKRKIRDVKNKKKVFNLVSRLGLEKRLISRRSSTMTLTETMEAQRILKRAINK